jgi:hypothetical protein
VHPLSKIREQLAQLKVPRRLISFSRRRLFKALTPVQLTKRQSEVVKGSKIEDLCSWLRDRYRAVILRPVVVAILRFDPNPDCNRGIERRRHMPLFLGKSQIALLLFLQDSEHNVDPIRLMKGMFIFTMEAPETWLARYERYQFIPYSYGPYSRNVDDDLDQFVKHGYVRVSKIPGKTWNYYSLSAEGEAKARELAASLPADAAVYLRRVREFVLKLSFRKLLDTVYAKYPAYAVKSVFKR